MAIEIINNVMVLCLSGSLESYKTELQSYLDRNTCLGFLHGDSRHNIALLKLAAITNGYWQNVCVYSETNQVLLVLDKKFHHRNYSMFKNSFNLPTTQLELKQWFRGQKS